MCCVTIRRLRKDIDMARRITASDPDNVWCRQATIVLNEALRSDEGCAGSNPAPVAGAGELQGSAVGESHSSASNA